MLASYQIRSSLLLLLGIGLTLGCQRQGESELSSTPDTHENRTAAARRYLALVPLDETLAEMAQQLAAQREPAQRAALVELLHREIRRPVLEAATLDMLVRHFTLAEIQALTAFNARPEARSIQRKLPAYTAALLPAIEVEIARVLSMTNAALAALQWPTRVRSFQATAADERISADFSFVNRSAHAVNILSITSTCACISGTTDRTNIPPNQAGVISVRFDFGMRTGMQSKSVLIQTDDPSEPHVHLQLEVDIPEVLRLTPAYSLWQVGANAITKTNHLALLYPGSQFEGLTCNQPLFRATWQPTSATTGEIYVTPESLTARTTGQVDLRVRVPPGVTRRFILYLAIDSEKHPGH